MPLTNTFFTYCTEDQATLDEVVAYLTEKGVSITHDLRQESHQRAMRKQMREQKQPVWLFISDNFLHSSEGVNNVLSFLEDPVLSVYINPVIIGELKPDEEYVQFWQNEYRKIRARKDQIPPLELETYNWRVIIIRSIQNEINDFLNHLKTFKIISFDEFQQDNYLYFYNVHGVESPDPILVEEPASSIPVAPVPTEEEDTAPVTQLISEAEEVNTPPTTVKDAPIEEDPVEQSIVEEPEIRPEIEPHFELLPLEIINEPEPEAEQPAIPEKPQETAPASHEEEEKKETVYQEKVNLPYDSVSYTHLTLPTTPYV